MFMMLWVTFFICLMAFLLLVAGMMEKSLSNVMNIECGFTNNTFSMGFMSIQFIFILIIFVLFDVELILLVSFLVWKMQTITLLLIFFMITSLWWEWWMGAISWKT